MATRRRTDVAGSYVGAAHDHDSDDGADPEYLAVMRAWSESYRGGAPDSDYDADDPGPLARPDIDELERAYEQAAVAADAAAQSSPSPPLNAARTAPTPPRAAVPPPPQPNAKQRVRQQAVASDLRRLGPVRMLDTQVPFHAPEQTQTPPDVGRLLDTQMRRQFDATRGDTDAVHATLLHLVQHRHREFLTEPAELTASRRQLAQIDQRARCLLHTHSNAQEWLQRLERFAGSQYSGDTELKSEWALDDYAHRYRVMLFTTQTAFYTAFVFARCDSGELELLGWLFVQSIESHQSDLTRAALDDAAASPSSSSPSRSSSSSASSSSSSSSEGYVVERGFAGASAPALPQ